MSLKLGGQKINYAFHLSNTAFSIFEIVVIITNVYFVVILPVMPKELVL